MGEGRGRIKEGGERWGGPEVRVSARGEGVRPGWGVSGSQEKGNPG